MGPCTHEGAVWRKNVGLCMHEGEFGTATIVRYMPALGAVGFAAGLGDLRCDGNADDLSDYPIGGNPSFGRAGTEGYDCKWGRQIGLLPGPDWSG